MQKIKILFVVGNLDIGGAEKLVVAQAKYIDKEKFEPHICTLFSGGPHNYEQALADLKSISRHKFNFKGKLDIASWVALYGFLRKENFDILVGNLFEANFIIRLLNLFTGNKIVFIFEHNVYAKKEWWKILADKFFAKRTAKIFGDSQAVLDFTAKQEGIEKSKFAVMHYPIELPEENPEKRQKDILTTKKDLGLPIESFVVGAVARFVEQKGLEYFIKSAKIVLEKTQRQDVYFLLVGYGKLELELRSLVKELGLESRVIIQTARDIKEILPILDIFVISSLWEAQPISMIEAMAYGCAVVATKVGGIQEIITDGQNGLLCEPKNEKALAEQILRLVESDTLRYDIANESKKTAGGYSMPTYIKKLEQYFIESYNVRHN